MKLLKTIAFMLVACAISGCGSSKQTLAPTAQNNFPSKVKLQLDECQELQQQKPEVRAWGEGISFSLSSASNEAELQARSKFARAIAAKIQAAEGNSSAQHKMTSTNGRESAGARDEGKGYNEDQLSIANSVIRNAVIIRTSQYMIQDGSYQVFVCLEYKDGIAKMAEEITEGVKQRVSDEDRIKMQYEFQKFRERVEEELKKVNTNE